MDVDFRHRLLKVIDIGCTYLADIFCVTGYEVRKLCIQTEGGWLGCGYPWNLVNRIGQPLDIGFPCAVNAPDSVCQRLTARVHLRGQRTLAQVHDRSAYHQVFGEVILRVQTEQTLALHGEGRLVLQFYIHLGTAVDDTLVEDRHCAHRIIDGIIHVLHQFGTTGGYGYATAGYVHRVQPYLVTARALEFADEFELVLLRHLLCVHQCGVI